MKTLLLILTVLMTIPCYAQQTVYRDRYGNVEYTEGR